MHTTPYTDPAETAASRLIQLLAEFPFTSVRQDAFEQLIRAAYRPLLEQARYALKGTSAYSLDTASGREVRQTVGLLDRALSEGEETA